MAAVPSIGRATRVEPAPVAPEASATQALYERYAGQIFGYCLHQLGSREEAEDAVQSTFLNAFRGLSRGVVPEMESAWLFKIAHNVCLSRRRSSWRRGRVESPEDFQEMQDVLAAPTRGLADDLVGLQDVLEQMPENQRRAILLREWQGLSYREIADEMELSQAAVETLIFRARRSLAQGLEQPPEPQRRWRRGAKHGLDLGGLVGILKALMAGGTAVVAITAGASVGGPAADHHQLRQPAQVSHVQQTHARGGSASVVGVAASELPDHGPAFPDAKAQGPRSTRPAATARTARGDAARDAAPAPPQARPVPAPAPDSTPASAPAAPVASALERPKAVDPPKQAPQARAAQGHESSAPGHSGQAHENHGQAKKSDGHGPAKPERKVDAAPPVPAPPTPASPSVADSSPQPPAAAPADAPAAPAASEHGNGGGHGNGKEKLKGH